MRFSGSLPVFGNTAREISAAGKQLAEHLYRNSVLHLKLSSEVGICQRPDESDESFFARVQLAVREKRDNELGVLVERYRTRIERLEDRLRRKELGVAERKSTLEGRQQEEWLRLGESVLGLVLAGRRPTIGACQRLERALLEADDIRGATSELRAEIEGRSEDIRRSASLLESKSEDLSINPRRSDISVDFVGITWYQP